MNQAKHQGSSRSKIWLPHAVAALACAVLIAFVWFSTLQMIAQEQHETEKSAQRTLANLSQLTQEHASRTLHAADQALQLIRMAYLREGNALDLGDMVAQGAIDASVFHQVGIIDAQGIFRLSNLAQTPAVDLSDRAHFKVHVLKDTGQVYISEPVLGRVSKKWTIQLTRRINQSDGRFGGVAVVSVDADYFSRFYSSLNLGADGIAALVGQDGVVRARKSRGQASIGKRIDGGFAMQLLAQGKTEGYSRNVSLVDQVLRLHHFRHLSDFPLWVTVALGVDEYHAQSIESRRTDLMLAGLLTLLLLGLLVLFSWHQRRERDNHQMLARSEERKRMALEGGALALWDWDLTSGRFEVDQHLSALLGYPLNEFHADDPWFAQNLHPDDWPALRQALRATLKGETPLFVLEHRLRHKDGHWLWLLARGKVTERDATGRALRMVGTVADISQRKQNEDDIRRLAFHDPLTELANRRLLLDRLQQARAACARNGQHGAVLFLDLDQFKQLNDRHGHDKGDALLQQVAQRLLACVREGDTVARLGGDEFVLMLAQLGEDPAQATERARSVVAKVLGALAQPYDLGGIAWQSSASIGVALFTGLQFSAEDILKQADQAMYQAKGDGQAGAHFYEPGAPEAP